MARAAADLGISEQEYCDAMNLERLYDLVKTSGVRCSRCRAAPTAIDCKGLQFLCGTHATNRAHCKTIAGDHFTTAEVDKLCKRYGRARHQTTPAAASKARPQETSGEDETFSSPGARLKASRLEPSWPREARRRGHTGGRSMRHRTSRRHRSGSRVASDGTDSSEPEAERRGGWEPGRRGKSQRARSSHPVGDSSFDGSGRSLDLEFAVSPDPSSFSHMVPQVGGVMESNGSILPQSFPPGMAGILLRQRQMYNDAFDHQPFNRTPYGSSGTTPYYPGLNIPTPAGRSPISAHSTAIYGSRPMLIDYARGRPWTYTPGGALPNPSSPELYSRVGRPLTVGQTPNLLQPEQSFYQMAGRQRETGNGGVFAGSEGMRTARGAASSLIGWHLGLGGSQRSSPPAASAWSQSFSSRPSYMRNPFGCPSVIPQSGDVFGGGGTSFGNVQSIAASTKSYQHMCARNTACVSELQTSGAVRNPFLSSSASFPAGGVSTRAHSSGERLSGEPTGCSRPPVGTGSSSEYQHRPYTSEAVASPQPINFSTYSDYADPLFPTTTHPVHESEAGFKTTFLPLSARLPAPGLDGAFTQRVQNYKNSETFNHPTVRSYP